MTKDDMIRKVAGNYKMHFKIKVELERETPASGPAQEGARKLAEAMAQQTAEEAAADFERFNNEVLPQLESAKEVLKDRESLEKLLKMPGLGPKDRIGHD